jgi:hypothetical protein
MRCLSTFVGLTAIVSVITTVPADAQPRNRQVGRSGPLVLRVIPRNSYHPTPLYLVGLTYEPRNAFDPIALSAPLGPAASNVTITLPVSSASCRITRVNATLFASPGCLQQPPTPF